MNDREKAASKATPKPKPESELIGPARTGSGLQWSGADVRTLTPGQQNAEAIGAKQRGPSARGTPIGNLLAPDPDSSSGVV